MKKILIFTAVIGMFVAMSVSCSPKNQGTSGKTDSISVDSTVNADSVVVDSSKVAKN